MTGVIEKKIQRFLPLAFDRITPSKTIDISGYAILPSGFHGSNPSLIRFQDDYLVSVRGINYVFDKQDMAKTLFTSGDSYQTINRFFLVDREFKLKRHLPALGELFEGVEDIKLFGVGGKIMGVGSRADAGLGPGACTIALIEFHPSLESGSLKTIPSPFGLRQEKNWAPFDVDGILHFIYSFDPLIVLRYDSQSGTVAFAQPQFEKLTKADLKFLIGGSSAGIQVHDGHIFAAHRRRVSLPRLDRIYLSRLYHLDASGTTLTPGHYFAMGSTIQFTNGLEQQGDDFIIAYGGQGDRDAHAHLCRVPQRRLLPTGIQGRS